MAKFRRSRLARGNISPCTRERNATRRSSLYPFRAGCNLPLAHHPVRHLMRQKVVRYRGFTDSIRQSRPDQSRQNARVERSMEVLPPTLDRRYLSPVSLPNRFGCVERTQRFLIRYWADLRFDTFVPRVHYRCARVADRVTQSPKRSVLTVVKS